MVKAAGMTSQCLQATTRSRQHRTRSTPSFDDSLREIEASLDSNPNLIHCEDITSYDYNWQNDFKCTRPDGSVFYTDEAGARAQDGLDPKAACRVDSPGPDAELAKKLTELGLCN